MLSFARNKIVGVEHPEENVFLAHGVLEDYIYALELDVEVKVPNFEITGIQGKYRRYTTPECPKAIVKLQNAVGLRILEGEFGRKVRRVVGKEGCTHFANLLIECCDGIIQAAIYGEWQALKEKGIAPAKEEYLKGKLQDIAGLKDSCMVYSRWGK